MANSLRDTHSISYAGCHAQVFLVFLAMANFTLLTVMAYDQYVAICQPLHYESVKNQIACVYMAAGAWLSFVLYSALHMGGTFTISFCGGNTVEQFFCDTELKGRTRCMEEETPNRTAVAEFLLLGFSDVRELQILHFVLFLLIYLAALVGNLLIISAVALDHHLHAPMYFFLGNLSLLDIGSISVPVPKAMVNSLLNSRSISYAGCVAQVFFFMYFAVTEYSLLTVMAYDRYVAICQPLHYEQVMSRRACVHMAASAWVSVFLYTALHTGNTFMMSFCGGNTVEQFFCEIPQLLKLACAGSDLPELGVIVFSTCVALGCFVFIVVSYVQIFRAVLRIPSEQGRRKAFSTCLPHLAVVSLFFFTVAFAYMKPTSGSTSHLDLTVAVLYTAVPPLVNPAIYSMRNKEIKAALRKLIVGRFCTKNATPVFRL
nr:olfactory receptor 14A16-like [Pelodiscus sinensis]|eukprot:XP_006116939.2 olfactory receptor 14A16-like [Pelodiscus sinensis]